MYKITYRKDAAKALSKLPGKVKALMVSALNRIAVGDELGLDIKKLEGREGLRVRVGSYRAIYRKLNDELVIDVIKIGSRGDVYK